MTILKYKDFQGSVAFEDGHLIVQMLHIDDFVTAECDRASDVQRCFEELVEDYIQTCASIGKDPCRPYKGSFNIRVSPELHKALALAAAEAEVSLNSWVESALRERADRSANAADILKLTVERLDHQMHTLKASSSVISEFVWAQTNNIDLELGNLVRETVIQNLKH